MTIYRVYRVEAVDDKGKSATPVITCEGRQMKRWVRSRLGAGMKVKVIDHSNGQVIFDFCPDDLNSL
ncbi:MAG: hypothetical protein LBL48_11730 [Azoarcus sp.]|jgi:hypothetical protein|nr:hypothetical protein [Azoarcus sp.]